MVKSEERFGFSAAAVLSAAWGGVEVIIPASA